MKEETGRIIDALVGSAIDDTLPLKGTVVPFIPKPNSATGHRMDHVPSILGGDWPMEDTTPQGEPPWQLTLATLAMIALVALVFAFFISGGRP